MKLLRRALGLPWETSCQSVRTLTLRPPGLRSYYDALGVTPSATQEDIKNAYYKLSKLYHPDRNKGSEEAAKHFRTINAAYEILGNFKKRRMYDKGIPTGGTVPSQEVPEDPQAKFYRSRGTTPSGKTPIYNFDEWSREHYGAAFKRREAAKSRFEKKSKGGEEQRGELQKESIIYMGIIVFLISAYFHHLMSRHSEDVDNVTIKKKKDS
ncbi:hypothetical protein B566_EDAN014364 [Ephemera danica]|nr:hypothetical protein B566_EDAN014364 [Ephemera danica]